MIEIKADHFYIISLVILPLFGKNAKNLKKNCNYFMSPSTRATHPRPQGLAAARDPYFSPRNRVKKGSGDENGARHCLCDIGYSYTFHTIPTVINFHKPG